MSPSGWRRALSGSAVFALARTLGVITPRPALAADAEATVFAGPFDAKGGTRVRAVSWNVAAVNNNPFEYWITHPKPEYKQLMQSVERFIINPGAEDVHVTQVFTPFMFDQVMAKMMQAGMTELDTVREMWATDYSERRVVSEFLRDPVIGKKRLASMPDRVTNTIQLSSGVSAFRPAVNNCYPDELDSLHSWFEKWLTYFFDTSVDVDGKGPKPVYTLLQKIKKSKYPAVTEAEEAASLPLQIVLQGIFDAVLVNLMLSKGGGAWQEIRREICESLNTRKNSRILEILQSTYAGADVVFLQEAGNQLVDQLRQRYADTHTLVTPRAYNHKRNQNSLMLLRSSLFSSVEEIDVPADGWEAGDLLAVRAKLADLDLTLASFHGDTNGLLTIPMLERLAEHLPTEGLLFGLDANTYEKVSSSTAHVLDFERVYKRLGFQACWPSADPMRYTTFNARTYLQPQLNKAAESNELAEKGDRNPKDFVLFSKHFESVAVRRDNMGTGEYTEDMVFPTLEFPSDHAALSVDLRLVPSKTRDFEEL